VDSSDAPIGRRSSLLADSPTSSAEGLLEAMRKRCRSVHGRGRVAEALYGLALDICGDEQLHTADRDWLLQALTGPVGSASQVAVDRLIDELVIAFHSAPLRVRPAIVVAPGVSRLDFE
jgi:hypothetical protein